MDSKCLIKSLTILYFILIQLFCCPTSANPQYKINESLSILTLLSPQRIVLLYSLLTNENKEIECNVTADCLYKHRVCKSHECQCEEGYPLPGPQECYKGVHFLNNCTFSFECIDTGTACIDHFCNCDYDHGYRQEDDHCQHPDFIIGIECAVFVFVVIFIGVFCRLKIVSIRNQKMKLNSHHSRDYRSSTIVNPQPPEYIDEAEKIQFHTASNASFGLSGAPSDQFPLSKTLTTSSQEDSSQKETPKTLQFSNPIHQIKTDYNFDNPVFSDLSCSP